eukprot:394355_1
MDAFQYAPSGLNINHNGKLVTNTNVGHKAAYGSKIIPFDSTGTHTWTIKIIKGPYIVIGIVNDADRKLMTSSAWETFNYGYLVYTGNTFSNGDKGAFLSKCVNGDTVTMVLNMHTKCLSYSVSNGTLTKAFDITNSQIGYCLAVSFAGYAGESVELISYEFVEEEQKSNKSEPQNQIVELQRELREMVQQNKILNEELARLKHENQSQKNAQLKLIEENKVQKQRISGLQNDVERYVEEEKEYKMKIEDLMQENKQLKIKSLDKCKYKEWNSDQILFWILSLENGKYLKYESVLSKALNEEVVTGEDLDAVDTSDIKGWGIVQFKDKKCLQQHIKTLISSHNVGNEGGSVAPTAFI